MTAAEYIVVGSYTQHLEVSIKMVKIFFFLSAERILHRVCYSLKYVTISSNQHALFN